jgi:hypothetical protein
MKTDLPASINSTRIVDLNIYKYTYIQKHAPYRGLGPRPVIAAGVKWGRGSICPPASWVILLISHDIVYTYSHICIHTNSLQRVSANP